MLTNARDWGSLACQPRIFLQRILSVGMSVVVVQVRTRREGMEC